MSADNSYNSLPRSQVLQSPASGPLHVSQVFLQGNPGSGKTSVSNGSSWLSLSQWPQKYPSSGKHLPTILPLTFVSAASSVLWFGQVKQCSYLSSIQVTHEGLHF